MTTKPVIDINKEREWLIALFDAISTGGTRTVQPNMSGNEFVLQTRRFKRKLTNEEFKRFVEIAPNFLCEPMNCQSGFNFGLRVYHMPDVVDVPPQPIFFISGEFLPEGMNERFDGSWEALSPLSHSEVNKQRLAFYNMQEPQSRGEYAY